MDQHMEWAVSAMKQRDQDRWRAYFLVMAQWINHPGYQGRGLEPPSLEELANQASAMLAEEKRQWPE